MIQKKSVKFLKDNNKLRQGRKGWQGQLQSKSKSRNREDVIPPPTVTDGGQVIPQKEAEKVSMAPHI